MTSLDTAIQAALTKFGMSWCPMFMKDGKIIVSESENFPCMIQNIVDKIRPTMNGNIERRIQFYLCEPYNQADFDVLQDIQPTYESLVKNATLFVRELRYFCEATIEGDFEKLRNETTTPELGVFFTVKFVYRVCN